MNLSGTIESMVRYVVYIADHEEVSLFGSLVNGTANVHSDIDLLIVTQSSIDKKEAISRIRLHANQFSLKADVLIFSKPELEKEMLIANGFLKAIIKSGKIIYKKDFS